MARHAGRRGRAFTLTELMIALVLVLLLVLAVTQIFTVTTRAIGKGNATGEVVRGLDAARVALQIDFAGTDNISYTGFGDESGILPTTRQPAIIISSTSTPAFMSPRDMEGDEDADPRTIDGDGNGTDETTLLPYLIGGRWFRTDSLSFCTSGEFESQTNLSPGETKFYGETTSTEAWVWYGHARVYDGQGVLNDDTAYFLPGEGTPETNPNTLFASQFVFLRTPILLKAQQPYGTALETTVLNDAGEPVLHLRPWPTEWDPANPAVNASNLNVGPLAYESEVASFDTTSGTHQPYPPANPYVVQDSRVDLAGVSAEQYRQRLGWVQRSGASYGESNGPLRFDAASPNAANPATWYNRILARYTKNAQNQNVARFWINPLVIKPLNAGEVSQASNYLLGGASQFITEYAGDFIAQTSSGDLDPAAERAGLAPDGIIDFTIDAVGVRHIRWYGMPRDVDGDGSIPGPAATNPVTVPGLPVASTELLVSIDVRPLADYLPPGSGPGLNVTNGFPFEKRLPAQYDPSAGSEQIQPRDGIADYLVSDPTTFGDTQRPFDWTYLVAWGPGDFDGIEAAGGPLYNSTVNSVHPYDFTTLANPLGKLRPSLIRVILQGIDSKAKLETPLSLELVFRVPQD